MSFLLMISLLFQLEGQSPTLFNKISGNYITVLDSIYEKYFEDGTSERYELKKIKILNLKGARSFSSISVSYTPYYNSAKILSVKIVKNDGKEIVVPLGNIKDIPAPAELGGTIFWGERLKVVELPSITPGDMIVYETLKKGGNWLGPTSKDSVKYKTPFPGYFNTIELFEDFEPIGRKVYVLEDNPSKPVRFAIFNGYLQHRVVEKDGKVLHIFEKENVKAAKREPLSGSRYDILTKLIVTNIPSWREMSKHDYELAEPNIEPDEYVKSMVDSLLKGIKDPKEKIEKLFYFVADEIRYLGLIESQTEGYEPHNARVTLEKRAGVCKDKAALLAALLRAAGFKAYYATTAVGMRMENIPSDQTNHAIVALETEPYKYTYLDPTIGAGGKDLFPASEALQGVLVAREEGDTLRTLPFIPAEHNKIYLNFKEKLEKDTLFVTMEVLNSGVYDQMVRRQARRGKDAFKRNLLALLRGIHPDVILDSLSLMDVHDYSKYYQYTAYFHIPHPVIHVGKINLLKPISLNESWYSFFIYELNNLTMPERIYPFHFRSTRYMEIKEELKLGKGYKISSIPVNFEVEYREDSSPWSGFSIKYNLKHGILETNSTIFINKKVIAPEDYTVMKEGLEKYRNQLKKWIIMEVKQ
ncbi:MAG: DUF3857 and transglutaminase domain-containing protein [Candidatus Hydrothermae bacterium]|nr:DUF3857 and transglutaminase domain-containing protein [Candidatus Hydrothermae bacterium]